VLVSDESNSSSATLVLLFLLCGFDGTTSTTKLFVKLADKLDILL